MLKIAHSEENTAGTDSFGESAIAEGAVVYSNSRVVDGGHSTIVGYAHVLRG